MLVFLLFWRVPRVFQCAMSPRFRLATRSTRRGNIFGTRSAGHRDILSAWSTSGRHGSSGRQRARIDAVATCWAGVMLK